MVNVGNLKTTISLDSAQFEQSMGGINRQLKALQNEQRAVTSSGTGFARGIDELRAKSDVLSRTFEVQQAKVNELRRRYEESKKENGENAKATQQANIEYQKAVAEMNKTENALRGVTAEINKQTNPWLNLEKNLSSASDKLGKFGDTMTNFGRSYSTKVTAPIVVGGAAVFKASMDFESAFADVRKTVDESEEGFKRLETGIREMAKEIPTAATEIAGVAASAGQLGIANEHILTFTRTMIDLGVATDMSGEEAATTLARLANITNMAQSDFDRLGATLVDLGNNFAATEGEIAEMAMRIAGAGSQIGMSEADILGFSTALRSVGINAEAGGTAISKLMIEMASDVDQGGERLKEFARIAGMSVSDFKKAFEEDAATAIFTFLGGLGDLSEQGESAFKIIEDLGLSEIRLRDTILRTSNARELANDALKTANNAWKENVALEEEAAERYKTTESQLKIMWNRLKDVAITLGNALAPAVLDVIDAAEPLIKQIESGAKAFSELDKEQQQTILKMIGLVAAVGPASYALGGVAKAGSGVLGIFSRLSGVIGSAGAARGSATLIGGFGALGATGGPLALVTLGIAGATTAAIAFHKHMSQEMIPEVDLFGGKVSDSTQEALGGFMELNDKATAQLNELAWSGKTVSEEMAEEMVSTFDAMGQQIVEGLQQRKDEGVQAIQDLFNETKSITEEEQLEILENVTKGYDERIKATEEGNARIKEILETASEENRELTKAEQREITSIREQMKDDAIETLTESEQEQRYILEQMKEQAETISKQQAAEVIKNSAEAKEGVVREAEEQYFLQKQAIETARDVTGEISAEQADKLIEEAKRQRDETIKEAEEMHQGVLDKAEEYHPEILDEVSSLTGEVYTLWDRLGIDLTRRVAEILTDIKDRATTAVGDVARIIEGVKIAPKIDWSGLTRRTLSIGARSLFGSNADGTNYFNHPSGLSWLGEEGPELVRHGSKWALADFGLYSVPIGSQVFTNDETKKILRSLNNIPAYATGISPPGEANRIMNQLENSNPSINFDGLFNGAVFNVRQEQDIKDIAKKLHDYIRTSARGQGVIMP